MYCKNCGKEMEPTAKMCQACGTELGKSINYCSRCGAKREPCESKCKNCGIEIVPSSAKKAKEHAPRSKIAAGVLAILLGTWGIHNFYLGYYWRGAAQFLLGWMGQIFGYFWIISAVWAFIEAIMLFCGAIDKDGFYNDLN